MTYGINRLAAIEIVVLAFCVTGALLLQLGYDPALHAAATFAGFAVAAPLWIRGAA